jgi:hypothetical protein
MSRLVVLGAGATRGASFVKSANAPCLPPLDADFFKQLQIIKGPANEWLVESLLGQITYYFGTNFRVSMEKVFSTFDHAHKLKSIQRYPGMAMGYELYLLGGEVENLLSALRLVFRNSLLNLEKNTYYNCDYHGAIVQWLRPQDSIISFNYDCLIDVMLQMRGLGKWNPRFGYGFHISKTVDLARFKSWTPQQPSQAGIAKSIQLYKLHGSMHFDIRVSDRNDYKVSLMASPYNSHPDEPLATVIAPGAEKLYSRVPFNTLWWKAALAIGKASDVIVVGYSFPESDLHSDLLFRLHTNRTKGLSRLIVVNPDRDARYRARDAFKHGIKRKTTVISLDDLSELPRLLGR